MTVYKTKSAKETEALAAKLSAVLCSGAILGLVGDLGSGKTCFVRGLATGLKIPKKDAVTSPTYCLIQEYSGGRLPLYHFDFYRIENESQAVQLDLEEYWEGKGVSVVEWGDRFSHLFPEKTQWFRFRVTGETERVIEC